MTTTAAAALRATATATAAAAAPWAAAGLGAPLWTSSSTTLSAGSANLDQVKEALTTLIISRKSR